MRYAVVVAVAGVCGLFYWMYGSDAFLTLALLCWPVVPAALLALFTRLPFGRTILIGFFVGLLPVGLLVIGNELFGSDPSPSSDINTKEGVSLLFLFFLGFPNAFAGALGAFLGMLMRPPAMATDAADRG